VKIKHNLKLEKYKNFGNTDPDWSIKKLKIGNISFDKHHDD
jgi:hypothetical protein